MLNGSMFAPLKSYLDSGSYVKTHPSIYLYRDGEIDVYRIFAVLKTDTTSDGYEVNFSNDKEFNAWVKQMKKESKYKIDYNPSVIRNVITLATCRRGSDDGRLLICAMLDEVIKYEA